jgi:dTDP-4-amino-4,6-dideoxygalactose transaminase
LQIPFNEPYFVGSELIYIADVIKRGQISNEGLYSLRVKEFIAQKFRVPKVLLTSSATDALEMAALLLDLKPGDEVIMPSFTFPSTANAVLLRGAKPVFAEIKATTFNIDPDDIERKITNNTKAIIPVHYAGIGCEMDQIMALADLKKIQVIEDAAQGVNASYHGQYLGTWGQIGCYSFHGTKNYTCGEGGALLINEQNSALMERAEILIQKGTNRSQFLKGEVDKYTWVDLGSSYAPAELLMAFLYAQLQEVDQITAKRKLIHEKYSSYLQPYVKNGRITITTIPTDCSSNYHLFYIVFSNETTRDMVKEKLNSHGVKTAFHYIPLHSSPMGRRLGYASSDLPVTEEYSRRLLRLPMSTGMTPTEVEYVIEKLVSILEKL